MAHQNSIEAQLNALGELITRLQDFVTISADRDININATGKNAESMYDGSQIEFDSYTKLVIRGILRSRFPKLYEPLSERLEETIMIRSSIISSNSGQNQLKSSRKGHQPLRHDADESESTGSGTYPSSQDHHYPDLVAGISDDDINLCGWCSEVISIQDLNEKSRSR